MDLCDRLRLMFFGNLYQDWSEFVLVELGVYRYETVAFGADSRALRQRADIDIYLRLHACRERLDTEPDLLALLAEIVAVDSDNPWLQTRREKLLFQLGQQAEHRHEFAEAQAIYAQCRYPGARLRQIRVLERCAHYSQALHLHDIAACAPENAAEGQQLPRIQVRLHRKLGLPVHRQPRPLAPERIDICLPARDGVSVERLAQGFFDPQAGSEGAVHYVENTLINSLFGLLCWPAIFAAIPGAFFHAYHSGPMDLFSADFQLRRASLFAACLAKLDSSDYQHSIRTHYHAKRGLQSPFVSWGNLDETLLEQALTCIPAAHLRLWFERLLLDIKSHRSGMPDLIQFWPTQQRYRMIEIKGPGDRLQDNQLRWLDFCHRHAMPVAVAHVSWA